MNLMRLHRNYLLSKINILIIGVVIFMAIILSFVLVNPFESSNERWLERFISIQNYEQSYLMFVKILMVLLSSYLFGIYFSKSGDDYSLLLTCSIDKKRYVVSKILTLLVTIFAITCFVLFFHVAIGVFFNKWYSAQLSTIYQFMDIYLISIAYGFLSIIGIRLLKSIYAVIIPFSFYLVTEVLADYGINHPVVKITGLFFPTTYLSNGNIVLLYGIIHLVLVDVIYLMISFFVYLYHKE